MNVLRRQIADWDRLTFAVVGLTILVFLVFPFGRAMNVPLAALAVIGIVLLIGHWREFIGIPITRWLLISIMAFWLPQLISLPWAVDFERALGIAIYFPFYGVVALPIAWVAMRHQVTNVLLYSLLAIVLFWSLDGLWQFISGADLFGFPYNGQRLSGMFGEKLTMGIIIAHLLPLLLEAVRRLMRRCRLWGAAILPMLAVIVLSGSRSAMLVMLLALCGYGVFVFWRVRPRLHQVLGAIGLVIATFAMVLAVSPDARDRVTVATKIFELDRDSFNQATSMRGEVWSAGWKVFKDDPVLGVGARGFEKVAVERGYSSQAYMHLHFYALDVLVSTGLVGLVAFVVAYLGFLLTLLRQGVGLSGDGALIAVGLALFPFNTHFGFYSSYTLAIVWPIIGLAMAIMVSRPSVRRGTNPDES